MHAQIQAALDAHGVEIAKTQTLEQQNKALLEGLNAQIAAGGNPTEISDAITAKTAALKVVNDQIAADIVANTPA